jgi:transcriptional regulator with XRE-family HTH domain
MATANTTVLYNLGSRMKATRIHRGISLTDIAVAVGSDKAAISRIENGIRIPDLITVGKIADEMDIPIGAWFMTPAGDQDNTQKLSCFLTERQEKLNRLKPDQIQNLQNMIDAAIQMASA